MKLRPFELVLVVIFGLLMVLALIILKFYTPEPDPEEAALGGAVTIWGTLPAEAVDGLIQTAALTNEGYKNVSYSYINPSNLNERFINALADGRSPDLLLISQESLVELRPRLKSIPYSAFVSFEGQYIEGAEIFALSDGIYGFPTVVDPLVMYWNEDLFSFKNLLSAPKTWEEVVGTIVPELTVRDFNRTVSQSALAMGEYENIKNAIPIISMLLMQGGSKLVEESGTQYRVKLNDGASNGSYPFTTAMTFYSNFSSVSNSLYSWNRALSLDRDVFLRDELALYFGFGSEHKELESKNPNLNFSVAQVPQGATANMRRTYGRFYTFVVPKSTKNEQGAYTVALELSSPVNAKTLADTLAMAPVHRSVLEAGSSDPAALVRYQTAPHARGWLNPALRKAGPVYSTLIQAVTADRSDIARHVDDAVARLGQVY